jgi:hypothetical protein
MSFEYLASPYSDPDPEVMEKRFLAAEQVTAELLLKARIVYSPIVHCHALARKHRMPTDAKFWQNYNFAMLGCASQLLVITLPGWSESRGVTGEMKHAREKNIPISYYHWKAED